MYGGGHQQKKRIPEEQKKWQDTTRIWWQEPTRISWQEPTGIWLQEPTRILPQDQKNFFFGVNISKIGTHLAEDRKNWQDATKILP